MPEFAEFALHGCAGVHRRLQPYSGSLGSLAFGVGGYAALASLWGGSPSAALVELFRLTSWRGRRASRIVMSAILGTIGQFGRRWRSASEMPLQSH
jgi:hypothetical protein